ncbi:putative bifunctional diguanylate cyclase/phosphodiesterase [Undibacterium sp. TJN19]|uniref:putative bifunctional diguanylate cyclase/phosphodiesterase n=1 Tax=Undibacterium sp. TJN19 TaxID=3413055 RepID=UPI003BF0BD21
MRRNVLRFGMLKDMLTRDMFTFDERRRYVRLLIYLSAMITLIFATENYLQFGYPVLGLVEAGVAIFLLGLAFLLSASERLLDYAESVVLLYALIISVAIGFLGGMQGTATLWVFSFPFLAFWLKDRKVGVQWNLAWLVLMVLALKFSGEFLFGRPYPDSFVEQAIAALVFYACIALIFRTRRVQEVKKLPDSERGYQLTQEKSDGYLLKLEQAAYHDVITGLPNRLRLSEILSSEIATAAERGHTLLIVNIRLQKMFDTMNILGNDASDKLIRSVASTMTAAVGSRGIFARIRRDEFVCIYRKHSEDISATEIIKEILAFRLEYKISDYAIHIDHTIGIAAYPGHAADAESLLKKAAQAMVQAQFANLKLAFYDEQLEQQSQRRRLLFGQLHEALQNGSLSLHYQGQIDMETGAIVGVEALARWTDAVSGVIAPAEFIPIAEKSGLIKPFTAWVMREAIGQLARWRTEGLDICMSINLSARSMTDPEFLADVRGLLKEFGLPPEYIVFELTESAFADLPEIASQSLQNLHDLGCRLSIDDFGKGYSSLSSLKNLKVNELKLDQGFVSTLADAGSRAIVQSSIQLAHNLNLKVVAEGIESIEQEQQLKAMGCDIGQGFYFCKPMAADTFSLWTRTWEARMTSALSA